jgi:hypothetical protein
VGRGRHMRGKIIVSAAMDILAEIHPASLNVVFHRLFKMGIVPSLSRSERNKVSKQLVWARASGVIPVDWIVAAPSPKLNAVAALESPAISSRWHNERMEA